MEVVAAQLVWTGAAGHGNDGDDDDDDEDELPSQRLRSHSTAAGNISRLVHARKGEAGKSIGSITKPSSPCAAPKISNHLL